jgi:hypothetical protein
LIRQCRALVSQQQNAAALAGLEVIPARPPRALEDNQCIVPRLSMRSRKEVDGISMAGHPRRHGANHSADQAAQWKQGSTFSSSQM